MCHLTEPAASEDGEPTIVGGTVIGFDINAGPTKYLVGTEQGSILTV